MESKKFSLFIGRWQPFHQGHHYIIQQSLDAGKSVAIAIRDTPITESDPYTAKQRLDMISELYKDEDVRVIVIPDIESVNIGRKVGYDIIKYDVPEHISGISATDIRSRQSKGDDSWKEFVPDRIANYLDSMNTKKETGGMVIWMTGLSGAGKTTLSLELADTLRSVTGKAVKIFDGDEVRTYLTHDLGFSKADRDENIKRISYVSKVVADCGSIAIVAAISPYAEARAKARKLIGEDRFFEVYVQCPLDVLAKRDVKGLYKKAIAGEIKHFTGISDPYEPPMYCECKLNTDVLTVDEAMIELMAALRTKFDFGD